MPDCTTEQTSASPTGRAALPMGRDNARISAVIAGLICLAVFLPALWCGFVGLDDIDFVVNNETIRNLDLHLLTWAFTKPRDLWIPFTWLSFALDYSVWGLNPLGYHLTNILLHAVNTALVVLIIDRLYKTAAPARPSGQAAHPLHPGILILAGLLFGIHPLRVESVAWITERKDVLNGVFTFSSILCYLGFVRALERDRNRPKALRMYGASYVLFCCSLMAKPVSIVVPLLLLLADAFPLGRFRKGALLNIISEKIPFLLASGTLALLTLNSAARKELLVSYDILPLAERVVVSGYALFEYARLTIIPTGIAPFHGIPNPLPLSCNAKALLAFSAIMACGFFIRKRPWLPVVCLSFVLPLIPVLAIFQNGAQAFAARYTYLPSLDVCIALAFGATAWRRRVDRRTRVLLGSCAVALIVGYGIMTMKLTQVWNNTESLWTRVIEVEPVGRAYKERAMYYLVKGKNEAAIDDLDKALAMDAAADLPYLYNYYAFRGAAYSRIGRFREAVADFTEAIALLPLPNYYYHRGLALMAQGKAEEARTDFQRAGDKTGPITWYE